MKSHAVDVHSRVLASSAPTSPQRDEASRGPIGSAPHRPDEMDLPEGREVERSRRLLASGSSIRPMGLTGGIDAGLAPTDARGALPPRAVQKPAEHESIFRAAIAALRRKARATKIEGDRSRGGWISPDEIRAAKAAKDAQAAAELAAKPTNFARDVVADIRAALVKRANEGSDLFNIELAVSARRDVAPAFGNAREAADYETIYTEMTDAYREPFMANWAETFGQSLELVSVSGSITDIPPDEDGIACHWESVKFVVRPRPARSANFAATLQETRTRARQAILEDAVRESLAQIKAALARRPARGAALSEPVSAVFRHYRATQRYSDPVWDRDLTRKLKERLVEEIPESSRGLYAVASFDDSMFDDAMSLKVVLRANEPT